MLGADSFSGKSDWADSVAVSFDNGNENLFAFDEPAFDLSEEQIRRSSKRKGVDDADEISAKYNKFKLGATPSFATNGANVIEYEATPEDINEGVVAEEGLPVGLPPLVLLDHEVRGLPDALSDTLSDSTDSFDSGFDEDSDDDEERDDEGDADAYGLVGAGAGGGGAGRKGVKTLQDAHGNMAKNKSGGGGGGGRGGGGGGHKKARGNYACSKCGLPKRGHVCHIQPRARGRRGSAAAAAAAASSAAAAAAAAPPSLSSSATAVRFGGAEGGGTADAVAGSTTLAETVLEAGAGKHAMTARQAQKRLRAALLANKTAAGPSFEGSSAQTTNTTKAAAAAAALSKAAEESSWAEKSASLVQPRTKAVKVNSSCGPSSEYSANRVGNPRQGGGGGFGPFGFPAPRPVVRLCHAASQCELGSVSASGPSSGGNSVRELYLDCQGFPESYCQGILSDPTFNVLTAKTVTVRRPHPKAYKPPRTAATASCGSGPDGVSGVSGGLLASSSASSLSAASAAAAAASMLQQATAAASSLSPASPFPQPFNPFAHAMQQQQLKPGGGGVPGVGAANHATAHTTAQLLHAAVASLGQQHGQQQQQQQQPGTLHGNHSALHSLFGGGAAAHAQHAAAAASAAPLPAAASALTLNHLALLMSSYQHTQQQQAQAKQQAQAFAALACQASAATSAVAGGVAGLTPASLASLLFPVRTANTAPPPPLQKQQQQQQQQTPRAVSSGHQTNNL